MLKMLIFFIILIPIFLVITIIMTKKYHIKMDGILYSHVNKIHKWGEMFIVIIVLVLMTIHYAIVSEGTGSLKPHYFVLGMVLLFVFRAFMEWIYERDLKKYIITILASLFLLISFVGYELIM